MAATLKLPPVTDEIYRVETIPPPAGEGGVYGAPTKVGVMTSALAAIMREDGETPRGVAAALGAHDSVGEIPDLADEADEIAFDPTVLATRTVERVSGVRPTAPLALTHAHALTLLRSPPLPRISLTPCERPSTPPPLSSLTKVAALALSLVVTGATLAGAWTILTHVF